MNTGKLTRKLAHMLNCDADEQARGRYQHGAEVEDTPLANAEVTYMDQTIRLRLENGKTLKISIQEG